MREKIKKVTKDITNQDIESISFSILFGCYQEFVFLFFELQSLYKKYSIRGSGFLSSQLHSICTYLNKIQELSLETDVFIKGFYSLYMIVDSTQALKDLSQQIQACNDSSIVESNNNELICLNQSLIAGTINGLRNEELVQVVGSMVTRFSNVIIQENQKTQQKIDTLRNDTLSMGMVLYKGVKDVSDMAKILINQVKYKKYRRFILAYGQYLNSVFLPLIVHQLLFFENWLVIVKGALSYCQHLLSCSFIY